MTRSGSEAAKRNGAFRNEGQAHDKVGNRRLPFFRRKLISKDQHRQAIARGGTMPPAMTDAMMPELTA